MRAFENLPLAVALFDAAQRQIAFSNRRWADLARVTGTSGDNLADVFPDADMVHLLADVLASGRTVSRSAVQAAFAQKDTATWWDLDLVPQSADGSPFPYGVLVTARDVTGHVLARREAEGAREVLADTDERLRLAQEAAGIGTWEWDTRADRIAWSPEQFRLHGMNAALDVPPSFERWLEMVHPDDRGAITEAADSGFRDSGGRYEAEFRLRRADTGEERWLLALGRVVEVGADGRPSRMLGVNLDITERRRAEETRRAAEAALARSEARFRGIFDSTFQFIGLLSPDGTLLEANRTALDFGGLAAEDVVGRAFWDARWWAAAPDPETPGRLRAAIAEAAAGTFVRYEAEVRGAGERTAVIDFSLRPVRDAAGNVVLLVPEGRDVTARRAEEETLRATEARLRLAQEAAGLGLWEYTPRTRASWLSPGYCALYGLTAEAAGSLDFEAWLAIVHPEDRPRMREATLAMEGCGRLDEEFRILRADTGEIRWIHSRAALFERSTGPVLLGTNQDVTVRRTAADALRESEARLRLAQETAGFGIWDWDARQDRQVWSPEQYVIHGIEPSAGPPSFADWLGMVHEEDRPALVQAARDGFGGGGAAYRLVFRLRRASDGEMRWILAFARALQLDADGSPLRLLGVNIDVTDERDLRFDLRRTKDLLETIGQCSPDAIFAKDRDGRMLFANPATLAAIGRSPDEVIGRTDLDWNPDRGQALAAIANDREVIRTGETRVVEEIYDAAGLGRRVWRSAKAPLRDAEGRIVGVVGVAADITPLKETEAALRASETRFRALVEASGPIIFRADAEGGIVSAPGWTELTGQPADELRGHGWLALVHPEERDAVARSWASGCAGGTASRLQYRIRTAAGAWRWIEGCAVPVRGPSGDIVEWVGTVVDIHDSAVAERDAQRTARLLQTIIESTTDLIWAKDAAGRIILGNQATVDLLGGGDRARVIGLGARELIPDAEQARSVMENDARIMRTSQMQTVEEAFGGHVYQSIKAPWRDGDGTVVGVVGVSRDVTEQRRVETALAEGLERLRIAQEASQTGIYDYDVGSGRILWDARVREVWGLTEDVPVTYEVFAAGVHPDDLPGVEAAVERALDPSGDGTYAAEYRVMNRHDGTVRRVAAMGRTTFGAGGPVRLIGTVRDVTARRATEAALAESEARWRGLADALPAFVFMTDSAGRNVFTNGVFQTFTGLPAEALAADGWLSVIHPDDRGRAAEGWRHSAVAGVPHENSSRFRRHDGAWRWFLVRAVPECGADGRIQRWIGTCTDVDDLRRAEAARGEAEERLRLAIEAAELGGWSWDLRSGVLDATPRCRALYGLSADGPLDWKALSAAILPEDRALRDAAIRRAIETRSDYAVEYQVQLPDGSAWRRSVGRVEVAPDGGVVAVRGVVFDIDRQKRAEATLRDNLDRLEERVAERTRALSGAAAELAVEMRRRDEMQAALLQSQKLEALGHLTGGVAHDFNNILAAIQGSYRLLDRQVRDNPALRDLVRQGMGASERGAQLIAQLMAFARKEQLRPRRVDTGALLRGAEELICQTAGPRVRCAFEVEADLWPVIIDPVRLETALLNLAANARDAMPGGGLITVSALRAPAHDLPSGLRPGREYVLIRVADTGTGMDAETLRRAAEPFFTTKPPGKGTGLGLASAHGFAEQSGGTLRLRSMLGEGTTVELFLPRADVLTADEAVDDAPDGDDDAVLDRTRHGDATILLVEDDEGVRPVTAALLRELGYRVIEASSAEAAEALAHSEGTIDMLVTDIVMPGAHGHVLAGRLLQEKPDLPVLYITGFGRGAELGDTPVLGKPFTDAALGRAVLHGLGRLSRRRTAPPSLELSAPAGDRLIGRLRHPALRETYLRWLSRRAVPGGLPDTAAVAGDGLPENVRDNAYLLEVLEDGRFRFLEAGRSLEERLGRPMVGEFIGADVQPDSAFTDVFGETAAAYRRCATGRGAYYDYARYALDSGSPMLFERLLLPLSADGGDIVTRVFGIAVFTEIATPPSTGKS